MKLIVPALLALSFAGVSANAQSLSDEYQARRSSQSQQQIQMMLVWQEMSCASAIKAIAAQQKESVVETQASRGPIGDATMYVTSKLSSGAYCACSAAPGEEPAVSCD